MPNPYAQATLTYYRRPRGGAPLWLLILVALFWLLLIAIFIRRPIDGTPMLLTFGGMFPTMALVWHIKDQFLDDRAHLMPNYRRVHATVTVAAVLIFTVLFPLVLSLLAGWRSVGFAASFMVMFSIILWSFLGKKLPAMAIPLVVIAIFTEAGCIYFKDFFSGRHEPHAYAVAIFGLATAAWGLFRLFRLTEEDPAYQKLQATAWKPGMSGQIPTAVPFLTKESKDWLTDRHIARLAAHARRASTSRWSRICRWQLGINVAMMLRLFLLAFLIWITYYFTNPGKMPSVFPIAMFAGMFPLLTLGAIVQSHGTSREVLLPVDRASYIRQMGVSAALGYFAATTVYWSVVLLLFKLFFPVSIRFDILLNLLAISALTQVLFFGVAVWIARYRSKLLQIIVLIIPFYLQMILMIAASEYHSGSLGTTMVLVAGILAVFGVLIAYDAYRRWLVADID